MQKTLMALLISILLLGTGCSTVKYQSANGEVLEYRRLGTQTIQGLELNKSSRGDITVKVDKHKVDADIITELRKIAVTGQ